MVAQQRSPQRLKSIAGAILSALGFLVLFANLDAVAAQITGAARISSERTPGTLTALAMATLHVLQAYAFDHAGFLSGLLGILVSFWPLIMIIVGTVLLRDAFAGCRAGHTDDVRSVSKGDR
jgi:hypothetical protein